MVPPIWLDDRGQPRPKQPSPRCGREIPVLTLPPEFLRFYGWQPFQGVGTVEGCGHRVEGIPVTRRGRVMAIESGAVGGHLTAKAVHGSLDLEPSVQASSPWRAWLLTR
jgi:hypothetical protein